MKKQVGIITKNRILFDKIRLLLRGEYELIPLECESEASGLSALLVDLRAGVPASDGAITLGEGGDIPLPFRHEELTDALKGSGSDDSIILSPDGKRARFMGNEIKLTELEYKLLESLLNAEGFVCREKLLSDVFGDECDAGIVNVYVYYLRRKLEFGGRKIIVSSRNEGYRIDEKYRRTR